MDVSRDKLDKIITEIADQNNCGMNAFIHRETLRMIFLPNEFSYYLDDFGEGFEEDIDEIDNNFGLYFKIEPPRSNESFNVMAEFVEQVEEGTLKNALISALNRRRPFANFKHLIDNSPIRQEWFSFKQKELENRVRLDLQDAF